MRQRRAESRPSAAIAPVPLDPMRDAPSRAQNIGISAIRTGAEWSYRATDYGFLLDERLDFASFPERGFQRMHKVVGPYGTGKSHTMAVLRYLAEQAGYLVAKVEVDGNAISLSEPARLLNALWNSLKGAGFETDSPLLAL